MVIKNKHPEHANEQARIDRLRQIKQLCSQKLAVSKKGKTVG